MAKTVKKVEIKKVEKLKISKEIQEFFKGTGASIESGEDFGFTEGTLVIHTEKCDIQVKLISPKSGIERYEKLAEETTETQE